MRWTPLERWIGLTVTAIAALYVWFTLQPDLLFESTTANGGDTGAHVWWPAYLRDHILPKWRLTGWAPDWYAGFPAGHFYFPLPALLIVLLDVFLPYNVAFKLVTVAGPVALPPAAYIFANGLGARWPIPPLCAVATLPFLFFTGYTIYGGNLASNLAGEFSFTIALALSLCFLGTLARALDTRSGLVGAAVLLAATALSHIIVTVFAIVAGSVIWLMRRPLKNLPVATAIAAVAALVTAVWSLPLVWRLGYTTDMGWTKEPAMGKNRNLLPLDLRWAFVLAIVGVVAGIAYSRRDSLTLGILVAIFGVAFVLAPEGRLWNARILPFYYLSVLFLAACGAAELNAVLARWLARAAEFVARPLRRWRAPGAAPPPLEALDPAAPVMALARESGPARESPAPGASEWSAPVSSDFGAWESGSWSGSWSGPEVPPSEPERWSATPDDGGSPPPLPPSASEPPGEGPDGDDRPGAKVGRRMAMALPSVIVVAALVAALSFTYETRGFLPSWIRWNYSGYERKPAYPEFHEVIRTMGKLPRGRALWEPSSGIDKYGTTLALELLPHFTDGKIGSMEGLYFESAGTTPYHFLMVAELANQPSNPVRDLCYRTLSDFDLGVRHLRLFGVRWFMAQSDEAKKAADAHPGLRAVAETGRPDVAPHVARWKIYEVLDSPLVEPLTQEPVVLRDIDPDQWLEPSVAWFDDPSALDRPLAADGPEEWARVDPPEPQGAEAGCISKAGTAAAGVPERDLPDIEVTGIRSGDDWIRFRVSEPGVPVLVKTSYFPNWKANGAKGPYRVTPNLMVVVPTSREVSLHYGRTPVDLAGMGLSVLGLAGLAVLARWRPGPLPPRRSRQDGLPDDDLPDDNLAAAGLPAGLPAEPDVQPDEGSEPGPG